MASKNRLNASIPPADALADDQATLSARRPGSGLGNVVMQGIRSVIHVLDCDLPILIAIDRGVLHKQPATSAVSRKTTRTVTWLKL